MNEAAMQASPSATNRPKLVFVGGGRLAGLLYSTCYRQYEVLGYVDDVHQEAYLTTTYGVPCLGTSEDLPSLKAQGVAAVVAITDASARRKYGELLQALNFPLATLVFPTAVVDEHAVIGPGCIIRHQAVIGPQVKLGPNCVVSDNAYVAHDTVVGAHTYISPGVNINGSVSIGEASFLGTGAVVIPERRIGDGCFVGAAACVTTDVPDGQTVVGVPARPLEKGEASSRVETRSEAASESEGPAPLVSVLMASYNHGRFVAEAIQSALDQTMGDLELIIVDDASTDDSVAVIQSFQDPRIRFVGHQQNQGIGPTKWHAFSLARGTYVAILNSDDGWLPDKLEKQLEVFAAANAGELGSLDRPLAAVFTGAQVIDEHGAPLRDKRHFYYSIFDQPNRTRHEWLNYFFHRGNCLCAPSVLLHRGRAAEVGYLDKRLRQLGDMDLWVRLALRYSLWLHPEKLTRFRVLPHGGNASGATMRAYLGTRWEYSRLLRHFLSIPSEEELLAIFPEARALIEPPKAPSAPAGSLRAPAGPPRTQPKPLNKAAIAFVVAQLALQRPGRHRQLFALETLFELLADEERATVIRERFGFDYRQLTDLVARYDVFGLADAWWLPVRMRRRLGKWKARLLPR